MTPPPSLAPHQRFPRTRPGRWIVVLALLAFVSAAVAGPITPAAPGVSFDQNLGTQLPLDAWLHDATGRRVQLRELFNGQRPVILLFGYSRCPQLCSIIANGAVNTLQDIKLTVGKDFDVVYVSIDPTDTLRDLAGMKRRDVGEYGRPASAPGWHYLGGDDATIHRVADAAGFHYTYDPRQKLYTHASGLIVVTPAGVISQYFFGVSFSARKVAAALRRAAAGDTGQSVFQLLLVCARGAFITGRYGRIIWISLEIACFATVLALFGAIGWMFWQEFRRRPGASTDSKPLAAGGPKTPEGAA